MNLQPLLSPSSVAMVGASSKEGSLGYDMVRMIVKSGYKGEIYPVNPRYDSICGLRCYESLESIGKAVDVVVLSVAAKRVVEQAENAVKNKARSLVVFANCVLEDDTEPKIEQRLAKICMDANIPMLGHNAMGFYNNDLDLRVCGFDAPDEGMKGNIAFVSQSGSVFSTLGHNEPQLKFNFMIATGTGHVTSLEDYMLYAINMPTTEVLGVYMESVRKPEKFVEALRLANKKNIPVVLMKVGRSELGAEFAKSHTGGLAGDDATIQAVFDHFGAIRCDSLCEMANTLLLFSHYPKNKIPGGLVAIADSGGERNLLADDAEAVGLTYAKLSDNTMTDLEKLQEYGQHADNPLDPWGTGIDFERIFEDSLVTMLSDSNAGLGVISQDLRDGYYLSQGCVDALGNAKNRSGKPVAFITNYGGSRRNEMTKAVNKYKAPVLTETRPALKAIVNFFAFRDFEFDEAQNATINFEPKILELLGRGGALQERESLAVLKAAGFSSLESFIINSMEDMDGIEFKFPVVLKTAVPGILHKADVGGVVLNISGVEALKAEYKKMSERLGNPCIVSPMVSFDYELIFGMKTDPTFGPMVIVGAGGILTELLKDSVVFTPEAGIEEIKRKLRGLKIYRMLTGFRHIKPVDMDGLAADIRKFATACATLSAYVAEIDVNPVVIPEGEAVALDALMVMKEQ